MIQEKGGSFGEIKVEKYADVSVFVLIGAMETLRSLELEEMLKPFIRMDEPKIVFDMKGVSHLSSSGIRVLLSSLREVNVKHGKMVLCDLSEVVEKMVNAIELNQLFSIYPDKEKAIKSFE